MVSPDSLNVETTFKVNKVLGSFVENLVKGQGDTWTSCVSLFL